MPRTLDHSSSNHRSPTKAGALPRAITRHIHHSHRTKLPPTSRPLQTTPRISIGTIPRTGPIPPPSSASALARYTTAHNKGSDRERKGGTGRERKNYAPIKTYRYASPPARPHIRFVDLHQPFVRGWSLPARGSLRWRVARVSRVGSPGAAAARRSVARMRRREWFIVVGLLGVRFVFLQFWC
jgi:hypothetical protein